MESSGCDTSSYSKNESHTQPSEQESEKKMKRYCCSLFPNDFEFERETLVRLWMAMEFSSQSCIENFCERYFDTLIYEKYLIFTSIDVKTGRKLYKFNHSGKEKTVYEEDFYIMQEDEEVNGSKPGHISLVSKCINETTFKKLQKFDGELRTLLFIHNYGPSLNKIPYDMFLILEFLRALDLSGSDIVELPRSIRNVRQLRYLDLSFTSIESLPESIDQLHQLQTLKLQGCKYLHELPKGIIKLICLRHLDLDVLGQLIFLPKGIGALTELCTLSAFLVDSEEGCRIHELKLLNNLKGCFCVSGLENVAHVDDVQEAALQDKEYVTQLQLRWSERISYSKDDKQLVNNIIASLKLNEVLEKLQIVCYPGSDIPAWVNFREHQNLISITLLNCNNNDLSIPLGQLPNLKYLTIIHMNCVTKIKGRSHEGGDEAYVAFPNLVKLEIECMLILETLIDEFKSGDFPVLSTLIIKQCPKLTRPLFLPHLQELKYFEMCDCPQFKCLPDGALPTSLETSIIDGWPSSQERVSEQREDWHGEEHIPNIWIDPQNICFTHEDGDFEDSSSTIEDICFIDENVSEDTSSSTVTKAVEQPLVFRSKMSNLIFDDDEPIEPPSATDMISSVFKDEPTLPLEGTTYKLLVTLSGRGATTNRLGADIVMVLDVSSSMAGGKLIEMKQALQFVIRKFSPSDRLSIVIFASVSQRMCPLRKITPVAMQEIEFLVQNLKADGGTNISAGLQLALKVLDDRSVTKARSSAIMLMSDGRQFDGGDAAQISIARYPVFTFGFGTGSDYDSRVLQGIAMKSHGGTFSLANPGDLTVAFSQCLGGLLSVLVQDVKLILTTRVEDEEGEEENENENATIKKVNAGNYPQSTDAKGTVTVSFGNLYQNEIRSILVILKFPAVPNNENGLDALKLECTYSGENDKITSIPPRLFRVKRSKTGTTSQSDPTKVEIARIETLDMMKEVRDLADKDCLEEALDEAIKARNMLEDVLLETPNTVIETLKLELDEMIKFCQTKETYTKKGRSFVYSSETSHSRQRFASRGDSEKIRPYATPRMDAYREQAKEFKKDPSKRFPTAAEDDKKELDANPLAGDVPTLSHYLAIAIDAL